MKKNSIYKKLNKSKVKINLKTSKDLLIYVKDILTNAFLEVHGLTIKSDNNSYNVVFNVEK